MAPIAISPPISVPIPRARAVRIPSGIIGIRPIIARAPICYDRTIIIIIVASDDRRPLNDSATLAVPFIVAAKIGGL